MNFSIPKFNINISKVVSNKNNENRTFYHPAFKSQSQNFGELYRYSENHIVLQKGFCVMAESTVNGTYMIYKN